MVTFTASGFPVESAQVCLVGDEIYETAFSDSIGKVTIEYCSRIRRIHCLLVVRGGNVIPYMSDGSDPSTGTCRN